MAYNRMVVTVFIPSTGLATHPRTGYSWAIAESETFSVTHWRGGGCSLSV